MAARATWNGFLKVSLVNIPIKVFPATEAGATISFRQLHGECRTRIQQKKWCPHCNREVAASEVVKGYEFEKDRYVVFTPAELKSLEEKATNTIEISEFVPVDRVDPVYYDRPYYLAPEKGGEKAYHLLAEVMRESGRAALARYAARGKQYLVMIRPATGSNALVMQQLLYADEVRDLADVPMPDVPQVRDAELKLAHQLVDQITSQTFEPSKYEDEVKGRILADIDRKVKGQEFEAAPAEEAPTPVIDLMEALKASLESGSKSAKKKAPAADSEAAEAVPEKKKSRGGKRG
jgi:DNA end-binding protein Ku